MTAEPIAIKARRAVVLACGGFEANAEMQRQFWQEKPVLNAAYMGNTGDGILMAQEVGAALWHMWHYHGVYGFKHPDPELSFRYPAKTAAGLDSGRSGAPGRQSALDHHRSCGPPLHERIPTLHPGYDVARHGASWIGHSMSYLRIPSYMIMDEPGRGAYPIVSPTFNDRRFKFAWSEDDAAGAGRPDPA